MNAAGQTILEVLLLMSIFILFLGAIIKGIPATFNSATPFLGAKIEQRLETGQGFAGANTWQNPTRPTGRGGVTD